MASKRKETKIIEVVFVLYLKTIAMEEDNQKRRDITDQFLIIVYNIFKYIQAF